MGSKCSPHCNTFIYVQPSGKLAKLLDVFESTLAATGPLISFSRPVLAHIFCLPQNGECGVTPWYILGNVSYWQLADLFC